MRDAKSDRLRKMAEEEEKCGGLYIPLTVACPSCKGVTKADDWQHNPLSELGCCPICRGWFLPSQILSGEVAK